MATTNEPQAQTLVGEQATLTEEEQVATLVPSHPSQRGAVTVWVLSNDNPHNTKILDSTDYNKVLYIVKPDFSSSRTMTNMYYVGEDGGEGAPLGFIEWHEFFSDKISFEGVQRSRRAVTSRTEDLCEHNI